MKTKAEKARAAQGKREASRRCIIKKKAAAAKKTVDQYLLEKFNTTLAEYITDEFHAKGGVSHITPQNKFMLVCYPSQITSGVSAFLNSPRVEFNVKNLKEALPTANKFAKQQLGGVHNFGYGHVYDENKHLVAKVGVLKNKKKLYIVNNK